MLLAYIHDLYADHQFTMYNQIHTCVSDISTMKTFATNISTKWEVNINI